VKILIKSLVNAFASAIILPFGLLYVLQCQVFGAGRSFPGWSQAMSLLPGFCGVYLRCAFYRFLRLSATDTHVGFGTVFSHPMIRLGRHVYIGLYCSIGDATIEDDVLISSHVSIINGGRQHGTEFVDVPMRDQPGEFPKVMVGKDSWIGERAVVMADIGRHCIVGAGAVVTQPVPDYGVAVGNPARIIRLRNEKTVSSRNALESRA